jgi:hypothetical protein
VFSIHDDASGFARSFAALMITPARFRAPSISCLHVLLFSWHCGSEG